MRAKLQIASVNQPAESFPGAEPQETLEFFGVSKSTAYPEDGLDEDNTYARYSPSVRLEMVIANPALIGKFKAGQKFYVDFTPVPETEAPAAAQQ